MSTREQKVRLAMRAIAFKKTRALLVLAVAAAALPLAGSTASAAPKAIELCAKAGTVTLPGELTSVPIWGFGIPTVASDCSTATASLPGPVLDVNQGDVVTVTLRNALPAGTGNVTHTLRFEVPGITFDPGATDVAVGAAQAITFTASAPGTYQYQSGGDAGRQEAMGLYGALIVRPTSAPDTPIPGRAYGSATTAFNVEATLVLSAVDPAFNAAPDTFDLHAYRATSWLINGLPYTNTSPGITATSGQRVLLRYVNAGFDNTAMALLGMHERVLARDARLLTNPFSATAETIPAGATEDAIATVPTTPPPTAHGFPLYNRQLHVTSGPQTGTSPTGGGMLTFIHS
jgi:FtsP/CotA-like multicopper oxidase with cupredoxin domain